MRKNTLRNPIHLAASLLLFLAALVAVVIPADAQGIASYRDLYSDTWAATDALGRVLPGSETVGPPKANKTVGMFYFLTFDHTPGKIYDTSKVLAADPAALANVNDPAWGPPNAIHYWGQPLFGYYANDDDWVLRKHAEMLSDAGVDVVIFDNSNAVTYAPAREELFKVWEEIRREGGKTPQVAFLCPFSNWNGIGTKTLGELYNTVYATNKYPDLWFRWEGKPLILADPSYVDGVTGADSNTVRSFFTFRSPIAPYNETHPQPNSWAWLQIYPQAVQLNSAGQKDEITVGTAQNYNAISNRTAPMSFPGAFGRDYHGGKEDLSPNAVDHGYNFQEQWDHALGIDPPFIFVTGWNEWTAGKYDSWAGYNAPPTIYVDEFDEEFSRDIEPMDGGFGDDYYYQLVTNIRRYKGVRSLPPISRRPMPLGSFAQWKQVVPEYRDAAGDTVHRNALGAANAASYVNNTGRNDIVESKVTVNRANVYFYVRTAQALTQPVGTNWMLLYLNTGNVNHQGWLGYDFVINRHVGAATASIEQNIGGIYAWTNVGSVSYFKQGSEMEIIVPRRLLGLTKLPKSIQFKWADNCYAKGDWSDFLLNGDAAPDGRFNYVAKF